MPPRAGSSLKYTGKPIVRRCPVKSTYSHIEESFTLSRVEARSEVFSVCNSFSVIFHRLGIIAHAFIGHAQTCVGREKVVGVSVLLGGFQKSLIGVLG